MGLSEGPSRPDDFQATLDRFFGLKTTSPILYEDTMQQFRDVLAGHDPDGIMAQYYPG